MHSVWARPRKPRFLTNRFQRAPGPRITLREALGPRKAAAELCEWEETLPAAASARFPFLRTGLTTLSTASMRESPKFSTGWHWLSTRESQVGLPPSSDHWKWDLVPPRLSLPSLLPH